MHEHPDVQKLIPPGTYLETVTHPGDRSGTIELAIFKEHRFSFYFWNRWSIDLAEKPDPPTLITIDWHRDLAPPSAAEKQALEQLDLTDQDEVSKFVWSGLDAHNDSHLLSAAYLNIIGDIILLKNYGEPAESNFEDRFGNAHRIFEFQSFENFEDTIVTQKSGCCYLDIDLDFFVKGKVFSHQMEEVTTYTDKEIAKIIDNRSPLFTHLLPGLEGITIASEPRYCGGIIKSNRILETVLGRLFTDELQWKH